METLLGASWAGSFRRALALQSPLEQPRLWLIGLGLLSFAVYVWAWSYGAFRPNRIQPFFVVFGAAFLLYALATWITLHARRPVPLSLIIGLSVLFNGALLFSQPTLSDDMFRYVWDGRVQGHGINPYRFASSAPELASLRDDQIWAHMNRIDAVTVYPPGAQVVFAALWRVVGDSVTGFKLFMVLCVFVCAGLLGRLLSALGEAPQRVIVFLWHPLLVFEIAQAGHVDALYLPLIVAAMLMRAAMARDRENRLQEALIGMLLGAATLAKLYPAMLLVPLWSVRDSKGRRRWRLAMPVAMLLTIAAGYALYIAPGVDTLGFLPTYRREFFNVGPLPLAMIRWAESNRIDFYQPVSLLLPLLVGLVSLYFLVYPAPSPRATFRRCMWPIGIYLIISQNLFSWYVLWILPLVALELQPGRWIGWRLDASLAWWLFSGLVMLSYTVFITGYAQDWAIYLQFIPLYALLVLAGVRQLLTLARPKETRLYA